MPSTFLSLHYHIVFSTKHREPTILDHWSAQLHEYLGGIVKNLGGIPQAINGYRDHVHLLIGLQATHCLADFVREIKKGSNAWIRDQWKQNHFAWQEGYSAFTVSATARDAVKRYINNQHEHHRIKTFREELIELLKKAEVEYEERFLDLCGLWHPYGVQKWRDSFNPVVCDRRLISVTPLASKYQYIAIR